MKIQRDPSIAMATGIRVLQRRKSNVRVRVYKPLEHAPRDPNFTVAPLLERFANGPAESP